MTCCEPRGPQVGQSTVSLSMKAALPEVSSKAVTPESHTVSGVAACKTLPGCPQAAITTPGLLKVDEVGEVLFRQAQKMVTMLWFD